MTQRRSGPDLSVVLVTPDGYAAIRKTFEHLRAQTVREQIEVIVVAPSRAELGPNASDVEGFFAVRVVDIGAVTSLGEARAAGIRAASARVVALIEDHAYPDPAWARALIDAHRESWAAVGPAVANANPRSAFSWSNFLIAYGAWFEPSAAGEVADVPTSNSSYTRELLLDCGADLGPMLEREGALNRRLAANGYRFYLEPKARIYHLNPSRPISSMSLRFHAGRLFGANRSKRAGWSWPRRLLYIGGAPLIPVMHLRRLLPLILRSNCEAFLLPRIGPALLAALIAGAAGEAVGYAFGAGDVERRILAFELHRHRSLTSADVELE